METELHFLSIDVPADLLTELFSWRHYETSLANVLRVTCLVRRMRHADATLSQLADLAGHCPFALAGLHVVSGSTSGHRHPTLDYGITWARRIALACAVHAKGRKLSSRETVAIGASVREQFAALELRWTRLISPPQTDQLAARKPGAAHLAPKLHALHAEQLEAKRIVLQGAILPYYHQCDYRKATRNTWVQGTGHVVVIKIGTPRARSTVETIWHPKHKWSGLESVHYLQVPADWRDTVESARIAVCDGMLTLAAKIEGITYDSQEIPERMAWSATWVRQGRGTSLETETGYIVLDCTTGQTAHGPTLEAAFRTLRRRSQPVSHVASISEGERLTRAIARALRYPGVRVLVADSIAAGNCESGTRSWCERWMPAALEAGETTVGEVLGVLGGSAQGAQASLALAACLHAIRSAIRAGMKVAA